MATRIQFRRGTEAEWTSANPILAEGELGLELDTGKFKVGVGTTSWDNINYSSGDGTLTLATSGIGLSGSASFTANQSNASSFTVTSNATNNNTVSTIVARDGSGNFSAGIITATAFIGDGSGLTGAGSTVFINNTTNQEFFPVFTSTTSGIITASGISTSKLKFNPSSGTLTATTFVGELTGTATSTTNIPNLTGDITSANTATTLATVNSNVGSFGSGGSIPTITVNAKGLVTGVTTTSVNPANDGTLTLAVSGTGLSGSASFTANQSGASSFTVTSNATNVNTVSTIVARDGSGNFSAGTITASLTGTASSTTNIPNLTGAITSVNTTTSLGSFTSANLATALTDETGSGSAVFATSPTLVTPALGTPSSGTLTSCTGLPISGLTASTSTALGVGTLELGHATDTTISRVSAGLVAIEGVNIVTVSASQTLTNKTLTSPTLTSVIVSSGGVNVTGVVTATDFNSTSDINLKENIKIIKNPIEKVLQLNGISFDWKDNHQSSAGVIAQDVEKVLPEIIRENDGNKSVNYNGLIGLLIEAVKEQQKQIDKLKENQ